MRVEPLVRVVLASVLVVAAATAAIEAQQRPLTARGVPLDVVCGPYASLTEPAQALRVVAGTERKKALFGAGETVIVNGGTAQGLQAGQHFFVRRVIADRFAVRTTEATPRSIHTAGWLTIVEARTDVSVATIGESCDGISEGDYLEPLALPAPVEAADAGEPDYAYPGQVILGDERRQLGAEGALMVVDRGSDHGLRPGQRLTIYRHTIDGGPVVKLADAVVVSTQPESSTVRIGRSSESVQVGDLVAIHR